MALPLDNKKHPAPTQDMPRPGGYPEIDFSRKIKAPRMSGAMLFLIVGTAIGVGFYKVGQGNSNRREAVAEQRAIRASLVPFLQAEEDRQFLRQQQVLHEAERRLMAHDPTYQVGKSPYLTQGVWYPPVEEKRYF